MCVFVWMSSVPLFACCFSIIHNKTMRVWACPVYRGRRLRALGSWWWRSWTWTGTQAARQEVPPRSLSGTSDKLERDREMPLPPPAWPHPLLTGQPIRVRGQHRLHQQHRPLADSGGAVERGGAQSVQVSHLPMMEENNNATCCSVFQSVCVCEGPSSLLIAATRLVSEPWRSLSLLFLQFLLNVFS